MGRTITRRTFGLMAGAGVLSACAGGSGSRPARAGGLPPDLQPVPNPGYDAWVASFRSRAAARGISQATLSAAFRDAGYLPGVVSRDRDQAEFSKTLEDYLSIAASDDRIAKGRAALARHRQTFDALEARFGVEAEVICAVWGLESFYGERRGEVPVISATSTLAYDGRRGAFFEDQLMAALKILQAGDTTPAQLRGSWAGAMGHTQFIPTSFLLFAVDFTGDGRRDIWSDDPTDSLASTAAYFKRSGWVHGQPWGTEVTGGGAGGTVIQPQPGGPRFAVGQNFRAIKRYNNSDAYAIGVGHLSDRIAGGGPLRTPFPPDRYGLLKTERIEMQQRLTAQGFDTGGADGVIGPASRAAISGYQGRHGLPVTGDPSVALLQHLRG